ncbi:MAG TPA: VOC family protein [Candidatus Limnocylindrales bacterium]|nr:VOC family protein [Candidatus Limnocylindrales bacterium]
MEMNATSSHITGIATVAVPATDPDRSLDFYCGLLGFEKRRDDPFGEGLRWIEVAPVGASTTIALAPPGGVRAGVDTGVRLTTSDCAADHETLRERGADVDDILRWPGVPPMFSLRDPDGNTLYVVESRRG